MLEQVEIKGVVVKSNDLERLLTEARDIIDYITEGLQEGQTLEMIYCEDYLTITY